MFNCVQKFIELLRKGTPEDRDLAIQCLRTALAPCALDAYPVSILHIHGLLSIDAFKKIFSGYRIEQRVVFLKERRFPLNYGKYKMRCHKAIFFLL